MDTPHAPSRTRRLLRISMSAVWLALAVAAAALLTAGALVASVG